MCSPTCRLFNHLPGCLCVVLPFSTSFSSSSSSSSLCLGGRNATLGLRSASGYFRRTSVVGLAVFTGYWYWYPLRCVGVGGANAMMLFLALPFVSRGTFNLRMCVGVLLGSAAGRHLHLHSVGSSPQPWTKQTPCLSHPSVLLVPPAAAVANAPPTATS